MAVKSKGLLPLTQEGIGALTGKIQCLRAEIKPINQQQQPLPPATGELNIS